MVILVQKTNLFLFFQEGPLPGFHLSLPVSSILCSLFLCVFLADQKKKKRGKMNESKRKQLIVYFGLVPGAGCSFDLLEDQGCLPNLRPVEDNGQLTLFSETHPPQSTFLF